MRVRAVVLDAVGGPFEVETLDLSPPRAGEVLLRVAAAGVCRSDHHLLTGATRHPLPVVPGHEGAGVVEAVGEAVTRVRPGDLVALSWAPACGRCAACLDGRPALCAAHHEALWAGTLLDGETRLSRGGRPVHHYCALSCFAERAVVPEASCVRLPPDVPPPVAALIGCAVTTGVGAVLNTARVEAGSSVVVLGVGGVGLSVVLGARLAGAGRILAVDRAAERCRLACALGADEGLPAGPDAAERIRAALGGRGADHVFEATGLTEVQESAFEAARPGGKVVLVGIAPMDARLAIPAARITREEKTILGSYYGSALPERDFVRIADLFRAGRLPLDRLISRTYGLEEVTGAYQDLLAGAGGRGVIVP